MPLEPGSRLGPFEVLSRLGAGGMGEVWRARDTRLQRDVAIKVLPDLFARDADRLARFTREAHVLASLNHPNIAAIYSLEEIEGVRFLVLELVTGETLKQRIGRAPVPVNEAIRIALQIADALEAAHAKGILHRDLKPANVNVTPEGKAKLLDFGLAKAFALGAASPDISHSPTLAAEATHQGVVLGTASYMSPEQARSRALDARSDLWAFGCVLYEMLAGRKAFDGESVSDILVAILDREPDWAALPAATPPPLRELLRHLLEKDPAKRPGNVGETRAFLEAAAGSRTTATFPASGRSGSLVAPGRRPGARHGRGRASRRHGGLPLAVDAGAPHGRAPRVEAPRHPPGDRPHGPPGRAPAVRRPVDQPRREAPERPEPRDHAAVELGDAQGDGPRQVGARHGRQPPPAPGRPADGRHAAALVLDLARGLARPDRGRRGVRPGGRALPARGRARAEGRRRAPAPPRAGRHGRHAGPRVRPGRTPADGLRRRARAPRALRRQGFRRQGDRPSQGYPRRRALRARAGRVSGARTSRPTTSRRT